VIAAPRAPVSAATVDVRVRGLAKRYGAIEAVRGIDFEVRRGEIFGLIGPDGAGKTTTFDILAGILEPDVGDISLLGERPREARSNVGYLTQRFSLFDDLSVDENLHYIAGLRDVPPDAFAERSRRYLALMDLGGIGERLAGELSGGMKQKLALCCALIGEPHVLLLDEPTVGVDPLSRREFWSVLTKLASSEVTIVVATPYLDEAERCHRIALIYDGTIRDLGTPADLEGQLNCSRLEIRSGDVAAAERALESPSDGFVDVQSFGDRVDVLVHDPKDGERVVRAALATQGVAISSIDVRAPTLENVFVARLRELGYGAPYTPFPATPRSRANGDALAIEAHDLTKVFETFHAVDGVTLHVGYGEIYGLLGANGAGKTTIIKMLCGLLEPTSGTIALAGRTSGLRTAKLRRRIGYMSQKFTLYDDLSIIENLRFYAGIYGLRASERDARIAWVLEISGLRGREHLLTARLPGGWKQRVAFGAAVMHDPEILFLDEPTSGVDPLARRQFWRLIDERARAGTAILVTTHYLEEAEQCHRLCFIASGRMVAEDSPSAIKAAQPGKLFEIATDLPERAAAALSDLFPAWRVALFGTRLHLVTLDGADLQRATRALAAAGIRVTGTRPLPFSLEDAFIGTIERASAT
jgi:ABC-2 type transport system ATP-binding protein